MKYTDWTSGEPIEKEWAMTTDPALREAAQDVSDTRTIMEDGWWISQKTMNALDAALAAAEAAPLDVERLARVLHPHLLGSHTHEWVDCDSKPWVRLEAETFAREYAALRSPDTGTAERWVKAPPPLSEHDQAVLRGTPGLTENLMRPLPDTETAERDWKRGPCAHGNPCRDSDCVEYGRWDTETAGEAG